MKYKIEAHEGHWAIFNKETGDLHKAFDKSVSHCKILKECLILIHPVNAQKMFKAMDEAEGF